ncbi:radical SAM protein [Accumulibacter sp.]|uniref:radical SAM protein n=1 Tax=Accumulibacter sp. TaxID=2053492 RepID=UPI0034598356
MKPTETVPCVQLHYRTTLPGVEKIETLDIELTERCNLSCIHCYIRRAPNDALVAASEMSTAKVCGVLSEARALGCRTVRFTGGEPLLRRDFLAVYSHAHRIGLDISLATNATLVTRRIASELGQRRPKSVSVSIYGWDEQSYISTAQRSNAFRKFLRGLSLLRANDIPFRMRYPPLESLVANSWRIRQLAAALGSQDAVPYAWELTLNAWHESSACDRLAQLRLSSEVAARERLKEPGNASYDLRLIMRGRSSGKYRKSLFNCPAAGRRPAVNAYGKLQVCLQVRHPETLYDLHDGTLSDAMQYHFPQMRALIPSNERYVSRCLRCVLRPACPQCPACSWMEHGTLDTPSAYYCAVMHAEGRLLGVLPPDKNGWDVDGDRNPERSPPEKRRPN